MSVVRKIRVSSPIYGLEIHKMNQKCVTSNIRSALLWFHLCCYAANDY